jgi:hypothetical protein
MIAVALGSELNAKLVQDLLAEQDGERPFDSVMTALQEKGLDESTSRELIWRVLALGLIEFTADRSSLRARNDPRREERVA